MAADRQFRPGTYAESARQAELGSQAGAVGVGDRVGLEREVHGIRLPAEPLDSNRRTDHQEKRDWDADPRPVPRT